MPSLIGGALMVCAVAMSQRVTLAWGTTLALLLLGRRLHRGPGRAAVDPRRAGAGRRADRAVPHRVLPPRAAAHRAAAGRRRGAAADPGRLHPGTGRFRAARALAGGQFLVGSGAVPRRAQLAQGQRGVYGGAGRCSRCGALLRPGRVGYAPWNANARALYAALGADPPAAGRRHRLGRDGTRRHPVPPHRRRAARAGRPGRRRKRPRSRRSGGCATWPARSGWTRHSGGPAAPT